MYQQYFHTTQNHRPPYIQYQHCKDMNEAYAATRIPTSPNLAYQPVAPSRESVDIATTTNVAYGGNDINSSANPTFIPLQSTSDNTSYGMYDYARP